VEKAGFKKAVSEVVELNVQDRIAINMALQVGQISEEMLVTGAAPLLETETSELGQVVDQKRVSNLPLNGRNFARLALLSPGTTPSETSSSRSASRWWQLRSWIQTPRLRLKVARSGLRVSRRNRRWLSNSWTLLSPKPLQLLQPGSLLSPRSGRL